ncbi:hypothetical protein HPB49_021916 [Dermacentor silvarum]|uniref:Uncharacterized protein n=1 Tax=Dermacentor silvarum TaxID=543639 RepID=A0ACB8E3Q3_DERSI|nr:hypothetical protein HPB49_021916 [Dermacentor silvarum]
MSSTEKRLLHPGVETTQVLTAHILAIKALRVLDSTGYILQLVCEPVCKYLSTCEDSVRSIVSNLTYDSCEELQVGLVKFTPIAVGDSFMGDDDDEDWQNLRPAPLGNEEAVQVLLANFLLSGTCADTEPEGRYLECLNQRFGEAQLNACEVMLRDLADSRRLNAHLASGDIPHCTKGEVDVSAIVVSAQFWPTFKGGTREAADVTESARVAVGYTVKLESKNNAVEVNRTTVITQLACNAIVMRGNFSCAFDISTFYVLKCTSSGTSCSTED